MVLAREFAGRKGPSRFPPTCRFGKMPRASSPRRHDRFKSGFSPFRNPKKTTNPATRSWDVFPDRLTALLPAERLAALKTALDGPVGFLAVRVADFRHFVGVHGESSGFGLPNRLRKEAAERFDVVFPSETLLFVEAVGSGETLLVFRLPPGGACGPPGRSLSLRLRLNAVMNHAAEERLPDTVTVEVGYAWMNPVSEEGAEAFHQRLFRAFCEAQRTAARRIPAEKLDLHQEFIRILETPLLSIHHQPVIDFSTGGVLGWEALMRGPADGNFPDPALLLTFAEEVGKSSRRFPRSTGRRIGSGVVFRAREETGWSGNSPWSRSPSGSWIVNSGPLSPWRSRAIGRRKSKNFPNPSRATPSRGTGGPPLARRPTNPIPPPPGRPKAGIARVDGAQTRKRRRKSPGVFVDGPLGVNYTAGAAPSSPSKGAGADISGSWLEILKSALSSSSMSNCRQLISMENFCLSFF